MRLTTLPKALLLALASTTTASPVVTSRQSDRGSYTVSGLGTRKQAILGAGGNTLDLAIAMLETEDMGTDYTYGDGKTEDSANFGVFKQNWGMLRVCATRARFAGETASEWNDGAAL
ncbi:hypothetical protein F5Y15DRAFT_366484, partial [Xylariaceae sp. FL0016]